MYSVVYAREIPESCRRVAADANSGRLITSSGDWKIKEGVDAVDKGEQGIVTVPTEICIGNFFRWCVMVQPQLPAQQREKRKKNTVGPAVSSRDRA